MTERSPERNQQFDRPAGCGNGSWITYRAASNNYPSSLGIGWSFSGNIFCLASYFSCVQNSYPWIQSTVYANGSDTASMG
jgi:hypothetical protein